MRRAAAPLGLAAAAILVLAGCIAVTPDESDDRISVVAVTNVYGDIADAVGGDAIQVTSIISSSIQDPHSYEASARDQLSVAGADIVITNGGGYDHFMEQLLEASDNTEAIVISAVEASGLLDDGHEHAHDDHGDDDEHDHADDEHVDHDHADHDHIEGFNEHVWYSLSAMDHLAHEIAHALGDLDAERAADFEERAETFAAALAPLTERIHELHEQWEGTGVAITETVPLYLLEDLGLDNRTPDEFSQAIEEGGDVPPLVLQTALTLIADGEAAFLAYNEQTAGRESELLRDAAVETDVPVVSFAETLPDGADYVSWMSDNLAAVESALA